MTSSTPVSSAAPVQEAAPVHTEVNLAVKNALLLAASLVSTLGVAVAVRIWMPRYLGPELFGRLHFAQELAAAGMFFTTLGVETYIARSVATRPGHASDFLGGLFLVRLLGSVLVWMGLAGVLFAMDKPRGDYLLVLLFAVGQISFVLNTSLAACLQAVGTVRELAVTQITFKIVWGAGIIVGLACGLGLLVVPIAFLLSEAAKVPVLLGISRKHLRLRMSFAVRPVLTVLGFSLPYYLNQLAHEVYGRLGLTIVSGTAPPAEVGYFGAASQVTTLVLMALPIINAVILPMGSRIAQHSPEALDNLMRGAVRLSLAVTVPLALVLGLNASGIVHLLFSSDYAPAGLALRVLAVAIPLSCYCVLAGMHLLQRGHVWRLTLISLAGFASAMLIAPFLIPWAFARLGNGGASVGAAIAELAVEVVVALLLALSLGHAARDRRLVTLLIKLAAIAGVAICAHVYFAALGAFVLVADGVLVLALGWITGAIPVATFLAAVRGALSKDQR